MKDKYSRNIDYLRISLTDRCNLRCRYCMPEEGIELIHHEDILSYEELLKLCKASIKIGINNFKLTGGEPLVRLGLAEFVKSLKGLEGCKEVTLTTNGVLLKDQAPALIEAGIDRINISLDTMDREKYFNITRRDKLKDVLDGIDLLLELGFQNLKINSVPTKPVDKEDLIKLVSLARDNPIDIRFIQLMPIGLGDENEGYSREEIKALLDENFGSSTPYLEKLGNGPAKYFSYEDLQGKIGFIDAIHDKFCSECNRIRLSATGFLKLCLHYDLGEDISQEIKTLDEEKLAEYIESIIYKKPLMHKMGQVAKNIEIKNMNQIGG